jgi:hypothetical protein
MGLYYDGWLWDENAAPPDDWRCKYRISSVPPHPPNQERDSIKLTLNPLSYFIRSFTKFGQFECNDSCQHNNTVALVERLALNASKDGPKPYPPSDPAMMKELRKTLAAFARNFHQHTSGEPLTADETAAAFRGKNERIESALGRLGFHSCVKDPDRYDNAFLTLKTDLGLLGVINHVLMPPVAYLRRFATVRPFGKVEFLSTMKWPRNISPRHPVFNFVWAQFTKPLEAYFYKHLSASGNLSRWCPQGKESGVNNPWVGKGLNKLQRGQLIRYKIEYFKRMFGVHPVVLSTDCTGYDGHMTEDCIKEENHFYSSCYPNQRAYLVKLLKLVAKNRFYSDGVRGVLKGGRMSGDMHTGLGNTVMNVAFIVTSFRMLKITRYDILADGDDTLIFVHPEDIERVKAELPSYYLKFGHELKVEKVVDDIFDIEWCQTRVVRAKQGDEVVHVCVNNPNKIFATMGSHIHCRDNHNAYLFFSDVSYAYSIIYSFVPFICKLATWRTERDVHTRRLQPGLAMELIHNDHELSECDDTLTDYCRAFDLDMSVYRGMTAGGRGELAQAIADGRVAR